MHSLKMPGKRTKRGVMSGKTQAAKPKLDRRVRHTRNALGDALIELMQEKPFSDITVQQVLDRAGVGRSTFYTHYRDKDDLFLSDVDEFFEAMSTLLLRQKGPSNRVAPVRELFAHIAEVRSVYAALASSGKLHDILELGQGHFARAIEQRLAQWLPARATASNSGAAIAHALAGALLSMMSWWVASGMRIPPEQMDELYHHIVWSGVRGLPAAGPKTKPGPSSC
jgi:AcrR family transcriptional regulator